MYSASHTYRIVEGIFDTSVRDSRNAATSRHVCFHFHFRVTQSDFAFPGEKNKAAETYQAKKSDYQAF